MLKPTSYKFLVILFLIMSSCINNKKNILMPNFNSDQELLELITNKKVLTFIKQSNNLPSYINFVEEKKLILKNNFKVGSFKEEIILNSNMNNVSLSAKITKNGKILREFKGNKLYDQNNLILLIPYIKSDEELLISTTYNWMDLRNITPIYMQNSNKNALYELTIDIPYGVDLRFSAAFLNKEIKWLPEITTISSKSFGLGNRFYFSPKQLDLNIINSELHSFLLQILISFKEALGLENHSFLDNWSRVSTMIYERISTYDIANEAIKNTALQKTSQQDSQLSKLIAIINFLKEIEITKQVPKNSQYQNIKPASMTFLDKKGSELDLILLLKSMLSIINIQSVIAMAQDIQYDPTINFYSPAIFSHPLLIIFVGDKPYYFDAQNTSKNWFAVSKNILGRSALVIKKQDGYLLQLPYEQINEQNSFQKNN